MLDSSKKVEEYPTLSSPLGNSDPPATTETNPLFQLSVSEYLESTVAAVLSQGLEDLCRFRPANPVDYLALYLLRRAQLSNAVEVPYSEAVPKVQEKVV